MSQLAEQTTASVDDVAERIFGSVLGTLETLSIFVGIKLGLYEIIANSTATSEADLASRAGMHPRYAREWLEYQATLGFIEVADPTVATEDRRYSMTPAHAEALTDADSLAYSAPFVRLVVGTGLQVESLIEAYRTGRGVTWSQFGEDVRKGQAEMNRPWFVGEIGSSWFPAVPDIHAKLVNGARIADIGCGEGWSAIGLALAYPNTSVVAYDIDEPSINAARENAEAAGVSDRVEFHALDVANLDVTARFDVVTAFECIHDMPDPIGVLSTMRRIVADDGRVVVMDEAVGNAFGERTDEIEQLMYGFSLFLCLPDAMSHPPSAGTGAVMRPSTLEGYAVRAGFGGVDVLPIEHDMWRFYSLNL